MMRGKCSWTAVLAFFVAMGGIVLAATSANAEEVLPVVEVFGHNEKNNYAGTITDMIIGSGMNDYGIDGNPGWPAGEGDPSTWTVTHSGYQSEWQSLDLLLAQTPAEDLAPDGSSIGDDVGGSNGKIGWTAFDIGASAILDKLYIWNERERNDRRTDTFNVYVAESPTVDLVHGPTGNNSRDYDFASGGWTLINVDDVLTGTWKGNQVVDLGNNPGRYVAIEILSNGGDTNRVGLAEIAITGIYGSGDLLTDADGDGDVDAADYIMVKTNFGGAPGTEGPGGDIADGANGPGQDGVVDWYDLQMLQDNYSPIEATNPVPEPATMMIMLAAGVPALLKRRRRVTA